MLWFKVLSSVFEGTCWSLLELLETLRNFRVPRGGSRSLQPPILTAGLLYRAGAETPLNFREKFRVFPRTILENFSAVDTQTAVLVSTAEVWISAPDTQTPILLVFWVSTADFGFQAGDEKFWVFFLRCLSRKSGSQHQLRKKKKTLPSHSLLHHPCTRTNPCFLHTHHTRNECVDSPPEASIGGFAHPTKYLPLLVCSAQLRIGMTKNSESIACTNKQPPTNHTRCQ